MNLLDVFKVILGEGDSNAVDNPAVPEKVPGVEGSPASAGQPANKWLEEQLHLM